MISLTEKDEKPRSSQDQTGGCQWPEDGCDSDKPSWGHLESKTSRSDSGETGPNNGQQSFKQSNSAVQKNAILSRIPTDNLWEWRQQKPAQGDNWDSGENLGRDDCTVVDAKDLPRRPMVLVLLPCQIEDEGIVRIRLGRQNLALFVANWHLIYKKE